MQVGVEAQSESDISKCKVGDCVEIKAWLFCELDFRMRRKHKAFKSHQSLSCFWTLVDQVRLNLRYVLSNCEFRELLAEVRSDLMNSCNLLRNALSLNKSAQFCNFKLFECLDDHISLLATQPFHIRRVYNQLSMLGITLLNGKNFPLGPRTSAHRHNII